MTVNLPSQNNYATAIENGWSAVRVRSPEDLAQLGAVRDEGGASPYRISVLARRFAFDIDVRRIWIAGENGGEQSVSRFWQILLLHYLGAPVPAPPGSRWISFLDIPSARGYAAPYNGRVVNRFCFTAGREAEGFRSGAATLGAAETEGGDLAFSFDVFPLVPLRIVWYAGDDELPSGASFLYLDNITSILDVEDIVVMAERVVSLLCGKPW